MNMKQNPTKFHNVLIQITPRNLLNKSVKEFPLHLKTKITSRFKLYNHSQKFVDHQIPLYLAEIFFFSFLFLNKKGVSSVGSSTPRHMIAMSNTTCITQALLRLSLKQLLSGCRTRTLTVKPHPHVVQRFFQALNVSNAKSKLSLIKRSKCKLSQVISNMPICIKCIQRWR